MKLRRRILGQAAALLAAVLMTTPALAAVATTPATVDTNQKGSITIFKKVENDGHMTEGVNGLETTDTRANLKGVEFTALKIADLSTEVYNNSAGLYYKGLHAGFNSLSRELGVTVANAGKADVYTAAALENALDEMDHKPGDGRTYTGETKIVDLVKQYGTKFALTDDNGRTSLSALPLGLYLVAETNYTGASDTVEGPAVPFLVSVPMTNLAAIGSNAAGTAWQYDVTVYPKNTTTGIVKKIVADDGDTLIDTDDTQIGSTVHQVIAADAPLILSGHTYKEFKIQDTMTEGLTFLRVTRVAYGIAVEGNKLSQYSGYTNLVNNTDYRVTVASDKHSFDVNLTDTALAKLDNASAGSKVIVEFDAELNSKAQVGPDATKNQNHPTLYWRNSNTLEHQVDGTPVKLFTYEIDLKKEGLTTPANATFNVTSNNQTVNFTKESDGIYHVFSASDDNPSAMVSTIAPAAGGVLKIKGLDSHKYTFTEVSTQVGYNLLRSTFDVTLTANSPVDGNLTSAVLTAEGNSIDILSDKGIASLSVVNSKSVTLRTGGSGNAALYAAGLAVLIGAVASGISANRSRTEDKKTLARGRRH